MIGDLAMGYFGEYTEVPFTRKTSLSIYCARTKIEALRRALLDYCRLDTLAMVKILEKLYTLC